MKTDQVTASILSNSLYWITEEMNTHLAKAAYSTNIKIRKDCSCALYTADGRLVAQGEFIPVHLGVMAQTLKEILKTYPPESFSEGDVIIHNDPYRMGSHLWDVMLFEPVFYKGKLLAFVGNLAHHANIGGSQLEKCLSTVFEEGLRLSAIKLYERGTLQDGVFQMILNNVRTPFETKGDLNAQTAANYRGRQRLIELADKYGAESLTAYFEAIIAASERGMRRIIGRLPDGEAVFEDIVEDDGIENGDYPIKVRVKIEGTDIYFDFSGSAPPGRGGVNAPWAVTHSAVFYAVKSVLGADLPTNQGLYNPIHLIRQKTASMVDARYPSAVSTCTCSPTQRVVDVIIGAFSKLFPDLACACDGHWCAASFNGIDPRTGRYSAYAETYGCGRGAKYDEDGADAHQTHLTNTANAPAEIIELEHPLTVERYSLMEDSGGAGKFRGGLGISRVIRCEATVAATAQSNRERIGPYGLFGGRAGKTDDNYLELSDGSHVPYALQMKQGERMVINTSGGGGWGNPLERDPEKVAWDVKNGYVSVRAAAEVYGVVIAITDMKVDYEATACLRDTLADKPAPPIPNPAGR